MDHPQFRTELNGAPASVEDLRSVATVNYGHFTSMQVRGGAVRGLALHLQRLQSATLALFGSALDLDATRAWMRQAAAGCSDLSLRVNVFSRRLDRDRPLHPAPPDVLITTAPARTIAAAPLRIGSVRYEREMPQIKHVGTFGLFLHKRQAQARGYDDALFVGADGAVAEGTIWNVGFHDGARVVWPEAPMLDGVAMQLLKAGLRACGVESVTRPIALEEIGAFRSAFFTNSSCTAVPLACIDDVGFGIDEDLLRLLDAAMATQPAEPL